MDKKLIELHLPEDLIQGLYEALGNALFPVTNASASLSQAKADPNTGPSTTGFNWGPKSVSELTGVKTELANCATIALTRYSRIDFTCYDGLRTQAEQDLALKRGTTQLKHSKHMDGLAVDLVPIIGGVPKWDWTGCYEIAMAMDQAATYLGIANHIRWGGCWDKTLADYGGDASAYAAAVESYKQRHAGSDFIDGPHFEWID